jgi:transcriptional regulator with XRE-family HTH domain
MEKRRAPHLRDVRMLPGLRAARERAGISQRGLARSLGMSQPFVNALERLRQGCRGDTLERLSGALGVDEATLTTPPPPEAAPDVPVPAAAVS